jgi:hypothetical protein
MVLKKNRLQLIKYAFPVLLKFNKSFNTASIKTKIPALFHSLFVCILRLKSPRIYKKDYQVKTKMIIFIKKRNIL